MRLFTLLGFIRCSLVSPGLSIGLRAAEMCTAWSVILLGAFQRLLRHIMCGSSGSTDESAEPVGAVVAVLLAGKRLGWR